MIVRELIWPSGREAALFGGFAISLLLCSILYLVVVLSVLHLITYTTETLLTYLLNVSLTMVVALNYFNYAKEQTSFETKLVGLTLLLTLGVIATISIILFGTHRSPQTLPFIELFIWIIPTNTLLVSLLLPLLLRITLLKPLNAIFTRVQQVAAGDLSTKIDLQVNDELGKLSQDFNQMTESLREHAEQLNDMRETMATDFHDQTGNMLSAIIRQAGLLRLKLAQNDELQPMIKSIVDNSNSLYATSKDFLWQLNHDSDDPQELFDYLTNYGQQFYNQFDIAFSASAENCPTHKFELSAALNLIFIFKEAMTNVVKHAEATEVVLCMQCIPSAIIYHLKDNGSWTEAEQNQSHYGLNNIKGRCRKNHFGFELIKASTGTQINITVPALPYP